MLTETLIILAILLVLSMILSRKSNVIDYDVEFTIMGTSSNHLSCDKNIDHELMGRAIHGFSYDETVDFNKIIDTYVKHFERVCPKDEAVLIESGRGPSSESRLEILDANIPSTYWIRFEIRNSVEENPSYYMIYYSNMKKPYFLEIRKAINLALEEIQTFMPGRRYDEISDDDDF